MKTRSTVAITVGSVAVLSVVGSFIVIMTGAYDAGATSPHSKPVVWVLKLARDRSIEERADRLKPPATALKANEKEGFRKFENNGCIMCHGAPGVEPTAVGKGLYPHPPEIWKESDETLSEDYWIISNGIKDTGMPAYKTSLKEEDLWLIASFVKRMPGMSAKDYQSLRSGGE
jgi:mono/diheme cytochrome c family protein